MNKASDIIPFSNDVDHLQRLFDDQKGAARAQPLTANVEIITSVGH
jgi:hypothetical protein